MHAISYDLFDHLPGAALILEPDLSIVRATAEALSLIAPAAGSPLEGTNLADYCRNDEENSLPKSLAGKAGRKKESMYTVFVNGRGQKIPVRLLLTSLPDGNTFVQILEATPEQSCIPGCRKLRILEEQYRHNPAGILLVNDKMEMISYNRQFIRMWNIPEEVQKNRDDRESLNNVLSQVRDPEGFLSKVYMLYDNPEQSCTDEVELKDGRVFYRHSYPIYLDEKYLGRVWYFLDITPLKHAQKEIIRQQKFQQAMLDNIHDGLVACNADGILSEFNRAAERIHGRKFAPLPLSQWPEQYQLFHGDGSTMMKPEEVPLARALFGEDIKNAEMVVYSSSNEKRFLRVSGQAMYDDEGSKLGAVLSLHDITDLKQARERLHYLAYHDALTGLLNRRMFHDLLEQNIRRARRNREKTAILFMDLDNFKEVNDRYGHEAGDRLLRQLADLLRQQLRDSDILCRWGGDEFVLALPEIGSGESACRVAGKLCKLIADDLARHCPDCNISTTIGIALYPDNGDSPDMLVRKADLAMYQAKKSGKNRYQLAAKKTAEDHLDN